MRFSIRISKLFPETVFYIKWAKNSKNIKTKRKLLKKAVKELNSIPGQELRRRIKEVRERW